MQTTWRFAKSYTNYVEHAGCGSWKCGAPPLRMRQLQTLLVESPSDGLLQSRAAWKDCTPHLLHTAKEASPNQRFFWFVLTHRSQTDLLILFTPWPTKRRKLTRNSRVGKILSTTHGRGNSSGAPRAVGVSNRFFDKCQLHALKTDYQTPENTKLPTCGLGIAVCSEAHLRFLTELLIHW